MDISEIDVARSPVGPGIKPAKAVAAEAVRGWGHQRLRPSLTDPGWLVLRRRSAIIEKWIGRLNPLDVLDVGGRIQPYRPLLQSRVRRYIGIDVRWTPLVDIVARAEQTPLPNDRFDLIICTQVLEYVPEPQRAIAEFHRVLKPGGCLFLSVPAAGLQDSDAEYWRFLPAALRHLLSAFRESEIVPEGSSIIGFFRMINANLDVLARYPAVRTCFRWTLCPLVNVLGELLERCAGSDNHQFTTNYSVCARK